ncbi:MAG: hypothetical protein NC452_09030, partial [Eubacterium sp.]|nr:hypothetical protein [Eubacterium sp.]
MIIGVSFSKCITESNGPKLDIAAAKFFPITFVKQIMPFLVVTAFLLNSNQCIEYDSNYSNTPKYPLDKHGKIKE